MANLDEISVMLGGLQADMRSAKEWFEKHEEADQRRFEALAAKIDQNNVQHSQRVAILEIDSAEKRGGWKILSLIGTISGGIGAFIYHVFGHFNG
jgi:hypothetical protein